MFLGAKIRFFSDIARFLGENHCLLACWEDDCWGIQTVTLWPMRCLKARLTWGQIPDMMVSGYKKLLVLGMFLKKTPLITCRIHFLSVPLW